MDVKSNCALIAELILGHRFFKVTDQQVVHNIVRRYFIGDQPEYINDYLREQNEAESEVVYLTGKYNAILARLEAKKEDLEAEIGIEASSEKSGRRTRLDWKESLFCNSDFLVLREKVNEMKILTSWLEKLSIIVFRRQGKLEPLVVNYRREAEADKRHNF